MAARAVAREQEWAAVATEMEAAVGTERTVVAMDRHGVEEAGAEVAVAAAATTVGGEGGGCGSGDGGGEGGGGQGGGGEGGGEK